MYEKYQYVRFSFLFSVVYKDYLVTLKLWYHGRAEHCNELFGIFEHDDPKYIFFVNTKLKMEEADI